MNHSWGVVMRIRKSLVIFCLVLGLLLLAAGSALAYSGSSAPPSHPSATLDQASPVFTAPAVLAVRAAHQTTYVYTTRTGACYHRHYCVSHHTHYKRTLGWAKSHGLRPCKVCRPPR